MAKKKRQPARRTTPPARDRHLPELGTAAGLLKLGQAAEARDRLVPLAARYPNHPGVWTTLVNAYFDLKDMAGYQRAMGRLIKLVPDEPDHHIGLAGAYLVNIRPVLALRTFRGFLVRWPDHPRAVEVRETVAQLESGVQEMLDELGVQGEEGLEIAVLHEESQARLHEGDYAEGRRVAEQLLRRLPTFVPGLNNLSQLQALDGDFGAAVGTVQRVLALDAENVHAHSNLTRFLFLSGRFEEARAQAERLKALPADRPDAGTKKAEALSYLGDDAGVLAVFESTEQARSGEWIAEDGLLFHLAAVAALRLGRGDEARRLWERALKLAPGLEMARENLADLREPVGERHAPWPFGLGNWIGQRTLRDLLTQTAALGGRATDRAVGQVMRRFFRQHPEIPDLLPALLDRGDPEGREFALRTAMAEKSPALLEALRDFALSARGPDALRLQAAQAAIEAGLLAPGMRRLWMEGEWRELMLFGYEIHGEVLQAHTPRVERMAREAAEFLRESEGRQAEAILEQALAIEPEAIDLQNNLAAAYELQGRKEEAEALVRQIYARDPDYVFARAKLADFHLKRGELETAKALLDPLMERKRFHTSEFAAFAGGQIALLLAEQKTEGARSWVQMWEQIDPDHPNLRYWKDRLTPRGALGRLLGSGR